MTRRKWLWSLLLALPLAVGGGIVYANAHTSAYICPLTGEELPCPRCCPLNRNSQQTQQPYICPVTGEELPCEKCCPYQDSK